MNALWSAVLYVSGLQRRASFTVVNFMYFNEYDRITENEMDGNINTGSEWVSHVWEGVG